MACKRYARSSEPFSLAGRKAGRFFSGIKAGTIAKCLVTVMFVALASPGSPHPLRQPVSFDDLTTGFGSIDISADGDLLAAELDYSLYVLSPRGLVQAALGSGSLPDWSPDGRTVAFYSTRSGNLQIWAWTSGSPRPRQITSIAGGIDPDPTARISGFLRDAFRFSWSPDSRKIAFVSRPKTPDGSNFGPMVFDTESKPAATLERVFVNGGPSGIPYSPDGTDLRFRDPGDASGANQIFVVDIASADVSQITEDETTKWNPVWDASGGAIFAFATALGSAGTIAERFQAQGAVASSFLLKFDVSTSRSEQIGIAGRIRFNAQRCGANALMFLSSDTFLAQPLLHLIDTGTGAEKSFSLRGEGIAGFATMQACKKVLTLWRGSGRLGIVDTARTASRRILAVDGPLSWAVSARADVAWISARGVHLAKAGRHPQRIFEFGRPRETLNLGEIKPLAWRNGRGETLTGSYLLPPNFKADAHYPIVVDTYPVSSLVDDLNPLAGNQLIAAAGIIVFKPAIRAPHSWMNGNKKYAKAGIGPDGWKVSRDDLETGLTALADTVPQADTTRVCLFGHSNGGGVAAYIALSSDRFRCAVIIAPAMVNWLRPAALSTGGRSMIATFAGFSDFGGHVEDLMRMSASFLPEISPTPLLVAVGDADGDFLLNAIEVYNASRSVGSRTTLVRYPAVGHLLNRASLRDLYLRVIPFLEQNLARDDS